MPSFLGMPLIAWIQIIVGTGVVLFALIKFLRRPRKKETDGYLIRDVHVIVGDGSELFHQNVLIKNGAIRTVSGEAIEDVAAAVIDGTGFTLMPGLIDSHVHIQGGFSCHNEEESDSRIWMRRSILSTSCAIS